jgi:hypothetical protein
MAAAYNARVSGVWSLARPAAVDGGSRVSAGQTSTGGFLDEDADRALARVALYLTAEQAELPGPRSTICSPIPKADDSSTVHV